MHFSKRWLGILLLCAYSFSYSQKRPFLQQVKVDGGLISGTDTAQLKVFKGVPFAAPPIGNLRWKAPQAVIPWKGVKACTAYSASPMQGKPAPFNCWTEEYLIPSAPIGEDCLYLNVWTGAKSAQEKRPVFVWIYGGGLMSGGSACPIYDGAAMAAQGVVFVSINYRVGVFGYLAHPALTAESAQHASGNYGLMDQIAALQWVQKNIAAFGGDPNQVTIAGQSAGAMSVCALVASPLTKGLFRGAIAESGGNFTNTNATLAVAEEKGVKMQAALGASTLEEMRKVPADVLLKQNMFASGIVVDGYTLPQPMVNIFEAGLQQPVNVMTGWNEDDAVFFGPYKTADQFTVDIERQFEHDADQLLRFYPAANDDDAKASQKALSRDRTFGIQNFTWGNIQSSQLANPIYMYRFMRKPPADSPASDFGSFHTAEVPYALGNLRFVQRPFTEVDHRLSASMLAYWVSFVKTGDPNTGELPHWPAYQPTTESTLLLNEHIVPVAMPQAEALRFLYEKTRVK
ncbi:para-nitrobenzyl esterase [Chitinophaga skermanii]|uniref:Carboxylic ester hydrolase n=1 Tax=Chitinophaga skermanii TaxID=331697 RepID=A0A327PZ81_9BACT|nr:carboxylesterase family protein [Chitinophaga skermanii]RAI97550.1 para-nitrobenzyl esterase [Chitinophaga skermanii]